MHRNLWICTAIVVMVMAVGCARHKDLPQPLGVAAPPTVANFTVTNPSGLDYDLMWDAVSTAIVRHYRIYLVTDFAPPELADTTTATTFFATLSFPIADIAFGVSVVTQDNVEGKMVIAKPAP